MLEKGCAHSIAFVGCEAPVTQGVLDNPEPTLDLSIQTVTQDSLRLYLKEAGTIPLLTRNEEVQLAERIEMGDKRAKDRLIQSNLRLVISIENAPSVAETRTIPV